MPKYANSLFSWEGSLVIAIMSKLVSPRLLNHPCLVTRDQFSPHPFNREKNKDLKVSFERESLRDSLQVWNKIGRTKDLCLEIQELIFFLFILSFASSLFSEKAMATYSSTLAWKIPWMEEPGGLQSMGSWRVGHNWVTSLSLFTFMHWRRKWQPTPVFLPGESQGRRNLVGCRLWGHTELDQLKWLSSSSSSSSLF